MKQPVSIRFIVRQKKQCLFPCGKTVFFSFCRFNPLKMKADIAESQKAVDRLEELVKRGENAKISVVRKVYSGCVVTIDQQTLTVKELQESVCFQKKKEGVVMISLK